MKAVHQIINDKIAQLQSASVEAYENVFTEAANRASRLSSLGFGSTTNVKENILKGMTAETIERAKIFQYFGRQVLTLKEIKALCNQFKLTYNIAERFVDTIPDASVEDILSFVSECREKKWNFGRLETEGYHIPLTSKFLVIAPPELFRKPLHPGEMTKAELKKWLEDDPIVCKQVYQFNGGNPATGFDAERRSEGTDFYTVVTAWGLEATLLGTGSNAN